MPHHAMYREALLEAFAGDAFVRFEAQPTRLRLATSRVPARSLAVAMGLGVLFLLRRQPPPLLSVHVIEAHALSDGEALADAVLASSAFPPFTPVPRGTIISSSTAARWPRCHTRR